MTDAINSPDRAAELSFTKIYADEDKVTEETPNPLKQTDGDQEVDYSPDVEAEAPVEAATTAEKEVEEKEEKEETKSKRAPARGGRRRK